MKPLARIATLLVWLICGYFAYGLTLGHFDHKFPCADNRQPAIFLGVFGPFGLIVSGVMTGPPYHWRITERSVEERWEIFHREFPDLSREYFERQYN